MLLKTLIRFIFLSWAIEALFKDALNRPEGSGILQGQLVQPGMYFSRLVSLDGCVHFLGCRIIEKYWHVDAQEEIAVFFYESCLVDGIVDNTEDEIHKEQWATDYFTAHY